MQPVAALPVIAVVPEERRQRDGETGEQCRLASLARPLEGGPEIVDVTPDAIEPARLPAAVVVMFVADPGQPVGRSPVVDLRCRAVT